MKPKKLLRWRGRYKPINGGVTGTGAYLFEPIKRRYKKITWN